MKPALLDEVNEWVPDPSPVPDDIDALLAERESTHGSFETFAGISQDLCDAMHQGNWDRLTPIQREALEMAMHKVARILNGDPDYPDHWLDISGYSKLVANHLLKCVNRKTPS